MDVVEIRRPTRSGGQHDKEVFLVEVEVPGLDRAGLERAPVPLDGPEGLEALNAAAPSIDPRDLREEPVRAPRDGYLREHHAGDRRARRVGLTGQALPRLVDEVIRTEGTWLHNPGIQSTRIVPDARS
jgi:hypothetical protein